MADQIREIVLDTLLTLEKGEEYSHRLIRAVLDKYNYLDSRDRSFIKRLTEGTIERQIELDHYLDQISRLPTGKMKPLIRCLLRMSAYQLIYMDAVPDSAVCNEAVKLAGKRGFKDLKGFHAGLDRGALAFPVWEGSDGKAAGWADADPPCISAFSFRTVRPGAGRPDRAAEAGRSRDKRKRLSALCLSCGAYGGYQDAARL